MGNRLRAYAHASVPIFWHKLIRPGDQPPSDKCQGLPPIVGLTVVYQGPDLAIFGVNAETLAECELVFAAGVVSTQEADAILTPLICTDDLPAYIVGTEVLLQVEEPPVQCPLVEEDTNWAASGIVSLSVSVGVDIENVFGVGVGDEHC